MAIVDMKRIGVLLMRRDHERLLHLAQRFECIQFTPMDKPDELLIRSGTDDNMATEETLSRIRWAISKLTRFDKVKQSMFTPLPEVERTSLQQQEHRQTMETVREAERLERTAGDLRGQITRQQVLAEQLKPWLELDIPTDQLTGTKNTRMFTGHIKSRDYEQLTADWAGRPVRIQSLGSVRENIYFVSWAHRSVADEFLTVLRGLSFEQAAPPLSDATPKVQLERLEIEVQELNRQIKQADEDLSALGEQLPQLRLSFESLSGLKSRQDAQDLMAHTASTSYMEGWVPSGVALPLEAAIKSEIPSAQVLISEPLTGEEPPVLLKNNGVIAPYEAVVSGFALPDYHSIDPTKVMMPFFACFFGMMVSDAGYGLVMALLIPILVKIMKPSIGARKIFWIIASGGLATIVWGALYNTWFGFSPWPSVFDPVNNSLPVIGVSLGIGALHLFAGLSIGAYVNFRDGKPWSALFDQFSWMMLVIGAGLLVLPQTAVFGKWLALAGAVIIVLTAGREKTKNPFKRLISGFGALYGVTGWISDLLSYIRLFGMGLATGVIGMVINQLVGMVMSSGFIGIILGSVLFVGAHLFNAAINILGAYVHACRLQYIEFFGKFYQEGGKPFKPLRLSPRYVRVKDAS